MALFHLHQKRSEKQFPSPHSEPMGVIPLNGLKQVPAASSQVTSRLSWKLPVGAAILAACGLAIGLYLSRGPSHTTPPLITTRSHLPSCGRYTSTARPAGATRMTAAEARQAKANSCLLSAYTKGRPAEVEVDTPRDDIGSRSILYFRVVGLRQAELLIEQIPSEGQASASRITCATLSAPNAVLTCG